MGITAISRITRSRGLSLPGEVREWTGKRWDTAVIGLSPNKRTKTRIGDTVLHWAEHAVSSVPYSIFAKSRLEAKPCFAKTGINWGASKDGQNLALVFPRCFRRSKLLRSQPDRRGSQPHPQVRVWDAMEKPLEGYEMGRSSIFVIPSGSSTPSLRSLRHPGLR
jgi:hypothetical protein